MPVTQVRQLYANFPETHALWVGNVAGNSLNSLNYPKSTDVILNVGNKFQHSGPAPIVPRGPKFIDMRIDYASMGNVMVTEVPLVCDVGYGLDDLIAAIEQLLTPALRQKATERALDVRKFGEWAKAARAQVVNNPDWNESPIIADRLTWEVAKFADPDAIIVHEAGSVALHSFDFDPNGNAICFRRALPLKGGINGKVKIANGAFLQIEEPTSLSLHDRRKASTIDASLEKAT